MVAVLNGSRLRQARELKRLTQSKLALEVGVAQPTIARAEQGLLKLSESVVETLALRLGFPVGWFYGSSRLQISEGSLVLFRQQARLKTSGDRAYLLSHAHLALSMVEHLERRFKRIQSSLPLLDDNVDVVEAARIVRGALGLSPLTPIPNLLNKLENSGIACIALPCAGIDTFEAFSVRIDRRPFIFLNPNRSPDRIRLTAGHEVDHLVRRNPLHADLRTVEIAAFGFAAELLAPEESMRLEMRRPITLSSLADLKPRWGIAVAALVRHARRLRFIEEHQYKYLNLQIRSRGWRINEPGSASLPPERPRALRKMFELVYGDNVRAFAADLNAPVAMVEAIIFAHAGRADRPLKRKAARPSSLGTIVEFRRPSESARKEWSPEEEPEEA